MEIDQKIIHLLDDILMCLLQCSHVFVWILWILGDIPFWRQVD